MVIVDIAEEAASGRSRLIAVRLASLTLRCMENWRREFGGYDETMILMAVAAITSDKILRTELPEHLLSLEVPIPEEQLSDCNIASIAAATGINRETVRRKIESLTKAGFLGRRENGSVCFAGGVQQRPNVVAAVRSQLDALRRLAESFLNEHIFEIRSPDGRSPVAAESFKAALGGNLGQAHRHAAGPGELSGQPEDRVQALGIDEDAYRG